MADESKRDPAKPFVPKSVQVGGESFLERIIPHIKKIAIAVVVIAVIVSIVFTVRYFKTKAREADTDKVAQVLDVGDKPVRLADDKVEDKDKDKSFASAKDRANAILDKMAKTDAKDVSPSYRGGLLFDAGKFDDALAAYTSCAKLPGMDGVVCREGVGMATEAKAQLETTPAAQNKGYEAALAAFKAEQSDDGGPRAAYAHYHQARMLVQLNKKDEAKKEFEKARDLGKDTLDLPELTRKRLASLGA
jgi:tetratricopeptide (TPR) repeat protein